MAAREEAQQRLAHLQRMEALGQLAGGIAHDFNNVLQAVRGGAGFIERRASNASEVRRFARMLIGAADRGASVTRRLLAFSRRGDLRAEPFDPIALLEDIREILSHTLGSGIGVRVEASPDTPPVYADKGQLETVLINLATNARDAMSGKGVLTLSAARERHPNRRDGIRPPRNLSSGDYVRLAVSDTGVGIAPDVLARVIEPFFTTKPDGQGTGLGLAMARGFIEQSGGSIAIESELGRGTTIHLWLPVATADPRKSSPVSPPQGIRHDTARILLVDDEEIVREVISEQLISAGYDVASVASASAALAMIREDHSIDLLISDLSMPGMDGITIVQETNKLRPKLPAILLTGFATNAAEIAVGGAASGLFSLMRKPLSETELTDRVKLLLEGMRANAPGA